MQYKINQYNPALHDKWRALSVKQPYANLLLTPSYELDGIIYAEKSIEVRSKNTHYRGDIMICSTASPQFVGMVSGVTIGLVELYDVKPFSEFTEEDWRNTYLKGEVVRKIRTSSGYGWMMRNPRRVVEFPVSGQLGIFNLVYTKGIITEYPRAMEVDKESYLIATGEKGIK